MIKLFQKAEFGYNLIPEKAKTSFSIQIEKKVTIADIENIIVSGVEGGTNYWMGIDNREWQEPEDMPISQFMVEKLLNGEEIKLYDIENEDVEWTLTFDKLLSGIKQNAEERPEDSDFDNMDATTADCIIQYALFNEIVYG